MPTIGYEELLGFVPDTPAMLALSPPKQKKPARWQGRLEVTRRQYSLWIGAIFIGEITFDRLREKWAAELSTQKYLKLVGRYNTEIEAHDALLDAAVAALVNN